jgi:hypothetical protein
MLNNYSYEDDFSSWRSDEELRRRRMTELYLRQHEEQRLRESLRRQAYEEELERRQRLAYADRLRREEEAMRRAHLPELRRLYRVPGPNFREHRCAARGYPSNRNVEESPQYSIVRDREGRLYRVSRRQEKEDPSDDGKATYSAKTAPLREVVESNVLVEVPEKQLTPSTLSMDISYNNMEQSAGIWWHHLLLLRALYIHSPCRTSRKYTRIS